MKQKQTAEPITSLCNISGIQQLDPFTEANFQVDDCLELFDRVNADFIETKNSSSQSEAKFNFNYSSELWRGINQKKDQNPASLREGFSLPNIQVELARHKHVGELSKYLLSKVPHLRMPSFERWMIDSKIEEHIKRQLVNENSKGIAMSTCELSLSRKSQREAKSIKRMKRKNMIEKSALENHLTSSGLRVALGCDPVIPSMADLKDEASQRLVEDIEQGSISSNDAKDLVKELCRMSCSASRTIQNLENHLGNVTTDQYWGKSSLSARISLEINSGGSDSCSLQSYSLIYSRKLKAEKNSKTKPFVVKVNPSHYAKLRDMFHSVHMKNNSHTKSLYVPAPDMLNKRLSQYSPATNVFHHLIFCLLLRYASLAGGQQLLDLRGGGMQGAVHTQVFDCISKFSSYPIDTVTECFASPLNAYSSRYFSIFHRDLDIHFGSVGDFFAIPIGYFRNHGVHEVNPPFSPGLMELMVEQLEKHLNHADTRKVKLTFLIVVPTCKVTNDGGLVNNFALKSFQSMLKSEFFTKHIELNAREHGYIEGSQHLRPTRFKESQYSTSVIILQSRAGKSEDTAFDEDMFEDELREAFSSRHLTELESRKREIPSQHDECHPKIKKMNVFHSMSGKKI